MFLIRNGEAADAPAMMGYMSQVNRETTFLSMEAGEFEKVFSWRKKRSCWPNGPLPSTI